MSASNTTARSRRLWPLCLPCVLGVTVLSGCSTTPVVVPLPPPPTELLADCPPLPLLANGTPDAVAQLLITDAEMYRECAARHRGLAELIRVHQEMR